MGRDDDSKEKSSPKGMMEYARNGVSLMKAFIGTLVAFFAVVGIIDWRVRSFVESEEYIGKIARQVRPYVIFDQNGSISQDGGAMQYLLAAENKPIEVKVPEEDRSGFLNFQITVRPNAHLAVAPLVEVLSTHGGIMLPSRGKGYEWVYDFHVSEFEGGDNQVRFRLEILK